MSADVRFLPKGHNLLEKKKRVNICLGAHLIFHLPSPNPTIFTRIEPLVFKFFISVFYISILQSTTLSLPLILFVLQICEHCESRSFMRIHLKLKELSKVTFSFLSVSLFQNLFGIKTLRVFLILLKSIPFFF